MAVARRVGAVARCRAGVTLVRQFPHVFLQHALPSPEPVQLPIGSITVKFIIDDFAQPLDRRFNVGDLFPKRLAVRLAGPGIGRDLTGTELTARRHFLDGLVPAGGEEAIRLSEEIEADGDVLLRIACEHGLEGIIAKDRNSTYRSGRGGEWLKIKCIQSDGFAIVGYEKSSASFGGIGRLLLAARKGSELVYVGGVGTGFNERSAAELREQMDKLIIAKPAVDTGRKRNAVFVHPKLIAEIEYRAWTGDGKLRHASYKGLREKEDDAVVYDL